MDNQKQNNVEMVPAKPPEKLRFDTDIAKFTPRQMQAVQALDSGKVKFLLYGGALGGGKLQSLSEPVLTPFGWRKIGDLRVGDTILNPTGQPQKVIQVHPQGIKDIYKVTCNDGAWTEVGLEHLWLANKTQRHRKIKENGYYTNGHTFFGGTIWTTEAIRDFLARKENAPIGSHIKKQNILIPLCNPLKFTKSYKPDNNPLTIEPYLLGVLIGDGSLTNPTSVSYTSLDAEISAYLKELGYEFLLQKDDKTWRIRDGGCLKKRIDKLGLSCRSENKFVPECYKWAPLEERIKLIQGLVDTDGYVDDRGHLSYTTVSKQLADDFQWIIRSLGGKATITTKTPTYSYKGEKLNGQLAYTIYFRTKIDKQLAHLPRKQERITGKFNNELGEFSRSIEKIEYVGKKEAVCITVSNPNGLYVTRDFIVTHNSYFLRWFGIRYLMKLFAKKGLRQIQAMIACEDYPTLKDRQLSKISREFPGWLGKSHSDHKDYGRCFILAEEYGGGIICFRNLDDASRYASAEFAAILVDELTKNTYDTFTHLRTRLRWPGLDDIECLFVAGTNPGSRGHGFTKQLWLDKAFPDEFIHPIDYRSQFAYVPSKATDNPHLDKAYWSMLNTLPLSLRKAFRDGDWNVFVGQAFQEWTPSVHVIRPLMIPRGAPIYMTFDWGFGAPFSVGWWWVDADGRVYRFNEWYGWNGTANQGLRLPDTDVVDGIVKRESKMGDLDLGRIVRIAGPDCFQKRPDYRGGGQGPSTFEVFAQKGIYLQCGDPNRELKLRQFRERLRIPRDERGEIVELPKMLIYENCEHFIRTIPTLTQDKNNLEDIDQQGEDHCFHGDTIIKSSHGIMKISELVGTEGFVKTIDGWAPYRNCRLTRKQAETVKVCFADGSYVVCTPDHEFLNDSGNWAKAIDLTDETCYVSVKGETLCESTLLVKQFRNLTEKDITSVVSTSKRKVKGYTERFGNTIMGQSRKGFRCIIKTMTEAIIGMKTWNFVKIQNIAHIMQKLMIMPNGLNLYTEGLPSGMEVKQVNNGIKNNIKSIAVKPWLKNMKSNVRFAGEFFQGQNFQNTVPVNVEMKDIYDQKVHGKKERVNAVSKFSQQYGIHTTRLVQNRVQQNLDGKSLKAVKVLPFGKHDVYCLTVPVLHCFSLSNGVVVSNCFDESSHICMARPVSQRISDTRPLTMAEKDWKVILGEESMSIHEQPGEGFEYVDENDIFG